MGFPVDFKGSTHNFGPRPGDDGQVGHLPCFLNGNAVVSCWELTPEEWAEAEAVGRRLFMSVISGTHVFPCYVGSEKLTRMVVTDFGKIW